MSDLERLQAAVKSFHSRSGDYAELARWLAEARDLLCPTGIPFPTRNWELYCLQCGIAAVWAERVLHAVEYLESQGVEGPYSLALVSLAADRVEARRVLTECEVRLAEMVLQRGGMRHGVDND